MRLAIKDLRPKTGYVVQVRSNDGEVVSEWSRAFSFTTIADDIEPRVPTNVTWVPTPGDAFVGEWDEVTQNTADKTIKIDRYVIELTAGSTVKKISVSPQSGRNIYTLSFSANKALFGSAQETIVMRVRAVGASGNKSDWSLPISATIAGPDPVTNLVAKGITDGIEVSWDGPADESKVARYEAYVGTNEAFLPSVDNKVHSTRVNKFIYPTMTYADHWFKVRVVDIFGRTSAYVTSNAASPINPFIVDTTPPPVPTFSATVAANPDGIGGTLTVTWALSETPEDLAGFQIRYRVENTIPWFTPIAQSDEASMVIPVDDAYKNYEVQVRSRDTSANYSEWSASQIASAAVNTPPGTVAGLTATAGLDSINISWSDNSESDMAAGVGRYEIQIDDDPSFATPFTYLMNGRSIAINGLPESTTYYYRARAMDSGGLTGPWVNGTPTSVTTGTMPTINPDDVASPQEVQDAIDSFYANTITPNLNTLDNKIVASSNGINRTYWSTSAAFGTTDSGGRAFVAGDQWFQRDVNGKIIGQWEFTTSWQVRQLSHQTISSIDVGNMTVIGKLAAANIETTQLVIGQSQVTNLTSDLAGKVTSAGAVAAIQTIWGHPSNTTLIDGGDIYANSVKASSILVGDFTNYVSDPNVTNAAAWTLPSTSTITVNTTSPNTLNIQSESASANTHVYDIMETSGLGGEKFYVSAEVYGETTNTGGSANLTLRANGDNGASIWPASIGLAYNAVSGVWTPLAGVITLPAGTRTFRLSAFVSGPVGSLFRFRRFVVRRMLAGELVVDGSLFANKIGAGTFTGGVFLVGTGGVIQSQTFDANTGFQLSNNGLIIRGNSTVSAGALKGGTVTATTINIGATGVLNVDSTGAIKSNNYSGSFNAITGTGWYLGSAGLVVNDGSISAKALTTGTITTGSITLSGSSAVIQAANGSWYLNGTGLSFASGTISASALSITSAFANDVQANSTQIDGSKITTGSISSSTYRTYGATPNQPVWVISQDGSATFSRMQILGNTVIGNSSTDSTTLLQSSSYSAGSTGWRLVANGDAFFTKNLTASNAIITGKFQTGTSGPRVEIYGTSTNSYVRFYGSNVTGPGIIDSDDYDLTLTSPYNSTYSAPIWLEMRPGTAYYGSGLGTASLNGKLYVVGTVTAEEYGSFGTGVYTPKIWNPSGPVDFDSHITMGGFNNINDVATLNAVSVNTSGANTFSGVNNDFPNVNTTTNTANVNMNTGASNRLRLVSSLSKYKLEQEDITLEQARGLLAVNPKTWFDRAEVEANNGKTTGLVRLPGMIAEDMDKYAPLFATYTNGKLNGIAYDRLTAGLLVLIKDQNSTIESLKVRLAEIEADRQGGVPVEFVKTMKGSEDKVKAYEGRIARLEALVESLMKQR